MKKITATITLLLAFILSNNADAQNNLDMYRALPGINVTNIDGIGHYYMPTIDEQQSVNPQYLRNHIYVEVWGYALVSLNYQRLFPKNSIVLGGGFGPNPFTRNFTLSGDGGVVISLNLLKQYSLSDKMQLGFGAGTTYDFEGWYDDFWDPFFLKIALNRFSVSPKTDRMYYGFSLYYIKWANWTFRPSVKLGYSF